jgi:8-oxo-dGTP pyrophosphatase MutT (NUDIX family)
MNMKWEQIQEKMANRKPDMAGKREWRAYGILVPLLERDGEIHLLFEVRSGKLRTQPGDICFPGGRMEKGDPDPKGAAVREACEELGISETAIGDVYPLDYIVQPLEGRIIYPFAGNLRGTPAFRPNEEEVEEIFTVPLSCLRKAEPEVHTVSFRPIPEEDFPFDRIPGGKNYPFRERKVKEFFYYYKDYCIWGLTAYILHQFLQALGEDPVEGTGG